MESYSLFRQVEVTRRMLVGFKIRNDGNGRFIPYRILFFRTIESGLITHQT